MASSSDRLASRRSPSSVWGRSSSRGAPDPTTTIPAVAKIEIEDGNLRLRLSRVEKLEAMHGDVVVPLSSVASVRTVVTAWPELRGLRAPGTGIPGVIAVGTRRGNFGRDFAVVHGKERAVVVELEGASYARILSTTPDADNVAAEIQRHLMPSSSFLPPPG